MADYTDRGILFKNDRKKNPKEPDYRGKLDVHGEEFELAGWKREGKNGTFLSLSIKAAGEHSTAPATDTSEDFFLMRHENCHANSRRLDP